VRSEQGVLFGVGSVRVGRPLQSIEPPASEPAPEPDEQQDDFLTGEPLLSEEAFVAPELTPSYERRLRRRQRWLITLGWHPLTRALGRSLRLHPDAVADPSVRKGGPRCGTCAFRQLRGGAKRDYPKCYLDPLRVTRGPATDVPKWWPACTEYKEDPKCRRASPRRR